jgi:hypothetical protein
LNVSEKNHPFSWASIQSRKPVKFVRSVAAGKVYALSEALPWTEDDGSITPTYRQTDQLNSHLAPRAKYDNSKEWTTLKPADAEAAWNAALAKVPEFHVRPQHLVTGAILPIWDRLGGHPEILRVQTDKGERLLGRTIPMDQLAETLKKLGVGAEKVTLGPAAIIKAIIDDGKQADLANGWRITRRLVAGEPRLEITGPQSYGEGRELVGDGAMTEIIQSRTRYFVPTGDRAAAVLARIVKYRPVVKLGGADVAGGTKAHAMPNPSVRSLGVPREAGEIIADYRSDQEIKRHPDYRAAKAGDNAAAVRFVSDIVKPDSVAAARQRFGADVIYAPVIAEEASGHNSIPRTLAEYYAATTGGRTASGILQTNRAHHTGAKAMERLAIRPRFDGPVEQGGRYVLVDDVSVMGSTLAEMADHIRRNGGTVVGIVTLANASRSGILSSSPNVTRIIERRYGDAIKDIFGITPAALTADEASYILNFRDADALRATVTTALRQRDERLRAKGLPPEAGEVGSKEQRPQGWETVNGEARPYFNRRRTAVDSVIEESPEHAARREALKQQITKLIADLTPGGVRVEIGDHLWVRGTPAYGGYTPSPGIGLIQVALLRKEGDTSPEWTGRHEIIHFLKETGVFTAAEWQTLEASVQRLGLMERYNVLARWPSLTEAQQLEEAIAEGFGEGWSTLWANYPPAARQVLRKLGHLLRRIAAAVRRVFGKDATIEDIFSGIESGYYKRRDQREEKASIEEMFAGSKAQKGGDLVPGGLFITIGGRRYPINSLEDASRKWDQVRDAAGTGSSETPTPLIVNAAGETIGYISYNGRVWRGRPQDSLGGKNELLYDNRLPATEKTSQGEQFLMAGVEPVQTGLKPGKKPKPQKTVEDLPLFDLGARKQGTLAQAAGIPTTVQRQRNMQSWLSKGQPIDRVLRMPFDWFGGVDAQGRWISGAELYRKHASAVTGALIGARIGAAVTNPFGAVVGHGIGRLVGGRTGGMIGEGIGAFTGGLPGAAVGAALGGSAGVLFKAKFSPEGRMAFMNPILETARTGLIDRYGLAEEYVTRDRQRALDERRVMLQGVEIMKTLKDHAVGPAEAKVLQAILTGETVGAAEMAEVAAPIRQAIDDLGAEAVSLGLVSAESFERNRGTYLHRLYMKHEETDNGLRRWIGQFMASRRKKIIGDQLKGRGIFLEVAMPRVMRDVPGFQEGTTGTAIKGESVIVLDRIPEQTGLPAPVGASKSKPVDRVFWPADKPIPPRFQDYTDRGTWEVRQVGGGKVTLWRDYSKAERTDMGEILDARYTITKTFMLMAHDLATGRFYKDIATNEEWTVSTEPPAKWLDAADWQRGRHRYAKRGGVEWVKVPNTDIANTGGKKRWGALSGKFVREEIWRDLNELDIMQNPHFWRKILTSWKLMKTARGPVVHMNNVMSNFLLMDMADVRLQDLVNGVTSYARGDAAYQDAVAHGVFGADMMSAEIRKSVLEPILREMQAELTGGQSTMPFGALGKLAERIWGGAKWADRKMIDAYRMEDDVFRMASYARHIATGLSPADAAAAAREEFIDYDIRAPWVNAARNSLLPFISYSYRATPLVARMVATRPWKLAKYALIAYLANALAYMLSPGDEDDERRSLDPSQQGTTWMGMPRMMRMPWRDRYGNPVFLDIRRWIPASDIFDTAQGQAAFPIPAPLNFGGPLMMGAELALNKQAFDGKPIVNELTDSWWEASKNVANYAYKSFMPSAAWVPGSWYWNKIVDAVGGVTDAKGNPLEPEYVIPSAFGVKLKPQDVEAGFYFQKAAIRDAINAFGDTARGYKKDLARNRISKVTFDAKMADIRQRVQALQQQAATLNPKHAAP